ncbi:putative hydroxypyruvate reductase [Agrobacterium rubi TR3 = NBRC 13261]|uniref:Putative hydroxypyruvate reductase n=1 Tax=Agrobacterium rubi TR3 = NBRC 13261 TaxID=1368415 RepID=A0A081CS27_9HYPH|nr:glycerate kinase [Agrobacterium rubi]MBP1876713.1 hydroxypyruvate reductase [Agrobacterium rubi]MCL6650910.1 hydroxypyruvate reductase [Agrobacterium rubi]GAK69473.1 putative hydroxypyruvate reductase [Agrobacterium rubi TR3 = NBRC 13261]
MISNPRAFLEALFFAAVKAADPYEAILRHLPSPPKGRTVVIGAGKAASQMAQAFERAWPHPFDGLVVARHGPVAQCQRTRILQSAHPVPDAAGLAAGQALMAHVSGLTADDLVIALVSGGGSALLPAPPDGFALADEIALNEALLASGAPISAMNVVRKHFSRIKGGRLAALAHPARVISLVVSDVPGDNPAFVASGPTVPDAGNAQDALRAIRDYRIDLPQRIIESICTAVASKPDDAVFAHNEVHVIASARVSLEAAAALARSHGVHPLILSDSIEGEARDIGRMHAALAREFAASTAFDRPMVLLSGGETTVTIGSGRYGKGGRNSEFLLSAALDLQGVFGVTALAADTDGIDGSENNAGAFADGDSVTRIRAAGGDAQALLSGHDAWSAFDLAGDLFVPGPTGTNVNDFRAFLLG